MVDVDGLDFALSNSCVEKVNPGSWVGGRGGFVVCWGELCPEVGTTLRLVLARRWNARSLARCSSIVGTFCISSISKS